MNKAEDRGGIRLPKNILTIILATIAVIGIFVGWGYTFATLKGDITHLKERVAVNEKKYDTVESTRLEWLNTIHKIELHLAKMDGRQEAIEKKLGL